MTANGEGPRVDGEDEEDEGKEAEGLAAAATVDGDGSSDAPRPYSPADQPEWQPDGIGGGGGDGGAGMSSSSPPPPPVAAAGEDEPLPSSYDAAGTGDRGEGGLFGGNDGGGGGGGGPSIRRTDLPTRTGYRLKGIVVSHSVGTILLLFVFTMSIDS